MGSMRSKTAICNVTETISNSAALCAVSLGSDPSMPEAVSFTNGAASLKPYAPYTSTARNGGGDLTTTWIARSTT